MDTIVAPITPVVNAPVIVIRISGDAALDALKFMRSGQHLPLKTLEPNRATHAFFHDEISGVSDEVIATYFKAPNSFTGEDVLEISFHGNPLLVRDALGAFYRSHMRPSEPGEFTKRAFLNGKIDLTQAEAVADMIDAKSRTGIDYAFNQLTGALRNEMRQLRQMMINVLAIVEAYIDFPDEDLPSEHEAMIRDGMAAVHAGVSNLLKSYRTLKVYRDGIKIAIVGRPNVGKSSLMNHFLRDERTIVSDTPGTTRDWIEETFSIEGIPVSLIDTAGIRFTDDAIERQGISRAMEKISSADLVLALLDLAGPMTTEDEHVLELTKNIPRIIVGTKADAGGDHHGISTDVDISVHKGMNLERLHDIIRARVVTEDSEKLGRGVAIGERHRGYLADIRATLDALIASDMQEYDIIAFELNRCMGMIAEITGEAFTEDMLSTLFSRFCIGK